MAIDVKIRFKSYLPGAGFDSAGGAKQGKTRVVGQIDVTTYGGGEGEPLKAQDLGLSAIDAINLRVKDENSGALSAADGNGIAIMRLVTYSQTTGHFYLYGFDGDGYRPINEANSGDSAGAVSETVQFDAFGDSANDVELT